MGFNSLGMLTIQKINTLLLPYYLFTLIICMLCHKPINGTPQAVGHHLWKHYRISQGAQFRITKENVASLGYVHTISYRGDRCKQGALFPMLGQMIL